MLTTSSRHGPPVKRPAWTWRRTTSLSIARAIDSLLNGLSNDEHSTHARGQNELIVDLTLVMKGFDFETVWDQRRNFVIDNVPVPAAQLLHIVESKQAAGREKDQLFLATHFDALQQLLKKSDLT